MIKNKLDRISRIEKNNKINGREITKEIIYNLHSWICKQPLVFDPPLTNYHVNIK